MTDTITVECPHCGESFAVVKPKEEEESGSREKRSIEPIMAELQSWEEREVTDPYSASDKNIPVSQRLKADIRINGEDYPFTFWYAPEHEVFSYVVRGRLDSGLKSKDTYSTEDGELFFVNRGVPFNSEKEWTFLEVEECRNRSKMAGLGRVEKDPYWEEKDNRFRIFLNEVEQPLVEDGAVPEELLLKLAKGLVALQTKPN